MSIGERIRALRTAQGLTQRMLADKLGISYVNVSQWEQGTRNPRYSTIQKIADALGVPVAFLLDLEIPPDEKVTPETQQEEVRHMETPVEFTIRAVGLEIDAVLMLIDRIKEKHTDAKIHVEM